jgi:hypothetical protein
MDTELPELGLYRKIRANNTHSIPANEVMLLIKVRRTGTYGIRCCFLLANGNITDEMYYSNSVAFNSFFIREV